jgi:hypothetical protein
MAMAALVTGCTLGEVVGPIEPIYAPATGGPEVMVGDVSVDPGRVVAHRLNRVEYNNTVRDLFFGLDMRPADAFPVDNFAEGFDNNAQELRMSNLLLEKYLEAADKVVPAAFGNGAIRGRLLPCDPADAACARRTLAAFAERAFRRPASDADLAPYLGLVELARKQGDGADVGVQLAMKAMLVSPAFLYRIEPDPPAGTTRGLDGWELASRLSYFLWSSMPDDELFARARAGTLTNPAEIADQVRRMLADRKGRMLVENLAGQWLYTRQIPELNPDPGLFPEPAFDAELRESMRAETHLYLREILLGDHSALELLKSDFTFANKRLAQHYGLPQANDLGDDLEKVTLGDGPRGGVLGQAGWLTLTSHPDTTSPTKRGKWIVSELLCQAPPLPPPGADTLPLRTPGLTLRQRLAQHASVEPCRSCHLAFDPLGLGLENFDAIGRWRDQDEGAAIDASGVVPGTDLAFDGPAALAAALQKDPRFPRCLVRKLLTFALGRGMEPSDGPAIDYLSAAFVGDGYRFRTLVETIAGSPLMTMRGGRSEP